MNDLFAIIRMTNVLEIEFYSDPEIENLLSVNSKLTLYRIVQENVNNVIKHANAKSVVVELFSEKDNVDLIMTDDGKGFDYESVKKGLGLKNMMSRAEMLGGAVSLKSKPGDGCKLTVSIPINQRTN
jgi:signal transduction histidine kinase